MLLNKLFTTLLVVLPVLSLYSIPDTKILIFELIIALLYPFMLYFILKTNEKINKIFYYPLIVPLSYIILQLAFLIVIKDFNYINSILLRTFHNVFYLLTAIVFIRQYFDKKFGIKVLKITAVFASVYIIIQSILINTAGFYLPGTLPFFETVVDEFNETIMDSGFEIRPRSIFSEPSAFGTFISLYLIIDLFSGEKTKFVDYIPNIIASIGLLLSRSTTSYLLGFTIWVLWSLNIFSKLQLRKIGIVLLFSIIVIPFILFNIIQTESFNVFIRHTFENGEWGSGVIGRIGNYSDAFSTEWLSDNEILFGRGMQPQNYYIPGIPRLFYYFGIAGILIWACTYLYIFFVSNWSQRRILLLTIISSFFGDLLFGINYLIYFPFIVTLEKKLIKKDENR